MTKIKGLGRGAEAPHYPNDGSNRGFQQPVTNQIEFFSSLLRRTLTLTSPIFAPIIFRALRFACIFRGLNQHPSGSRHSNFILGKTFFDKCSRLLATIPT
jgi:hypothetical protein